MFSSLATGNSQLLQIFGLLKLGRVLRLGCIITFLNVKVDLKMSLKLLKLVFFLVMYIHCIACLWFMIAEGNKLWIPPVDYVWLKTNVYNENHTSKYLVSLYHSVLLLAGNDIGPRGSFQVLFCGSLVMMGAIINANLFGELAVLVTALNRKSTQYQEKIDTANTAMKNMKLPTLIQQRVQNYMMSTQSSLDTQKELNLSPEAERWHRDSGLLDEVVNSPVDSINVEKLACLFQNPS